MDRDTFIETQALTPRETPASNVGGREGKTKGEEEGEKIEEEGETIIGEETKVEEKETTNTRQGEADEKGEERMSRKKTSPPLRT